MPDWTWHPVARPIVSALPPSTGKRLVLRFAAALGRIPGLIQWFGQLRPPRALRRELFGAPLASPVFVAAGIDLTGEALAALTQLGVGAVEVGPAETSADIEQIAQAIDRVHLQEGLQVWVRLRVTESSLRLTAIGPLAGRADALVIDGELPSGMAADDLRRMFGGPVLRVRRIDQPIADDGWDGVLVEGTAADLLEFAFHKSTPTEVMLCVAADGAPADLAALALSGVDAVGLSGSQLAAEGPGFAGRVNGALFAALSRNAPPAQRATVRDIARSPWVFAFVLAAGLALGGLGAGVITLGPVLLGYDEHFLHLDLAQVRAIDPRLIGFLQHDRITLAGTMVSIGILYAALAQGMRHGMAWARTGLAASGIVGFGSLLLFLAFGYFDPLHAGLSLLLLPFFALALATPMPALRAETEPDPDTPERRRALVGQLLMVTLAVGLFLGGTVIAVVGCRGVFVNSDLHFLHTNPAALRAANPHLLSFIAHDRAGFGGALMSDALALLALALWAWRPGFAWVWWSVFLAGAVGFGATIAVHLAVDYTDVGHLAPVGIAGVLFAASLALSRSYLLCRPAGRRVASTT